MKILFVAPRFHTNQYPIVKALSKENEVYFWAQRKGECECYDSVQPQIIKRGLFECCFDRFLDVRYGRHSDRAIQKRMKYFFPGIISYMHEIKKLKPDLIITRDRNVTTMVTTVISRLLRLKILLYTQVPLEFEDISKLKKIVNLVCYPKYRITPIREKNSAYVCTDTSYYLPFIYEKLTVESEYTVCDKIRILTVAKFYPRKNILMLLNVIKKLSFKYNIYLTIVGQISNQENEDYYNQVMEKIEELELNHLIEIKINRPYNRMGEEYIHNDIFVLPSTKESAAVSHIEAMSYGVPAICSDTCGTANYIENGINGYLFTDMDENDLFEKMNILCSMKDKFPQLRKKVEDYMKQNFSEESYIRFFNAMLHWLN